MWSRDGTRLAGVPGDGQAVVKVWDLPRGTLVRTITAESAGGPAALAPDGRAVATGGEKGRVRIVDVVTGRAISTLTGHRGAARALAYSPDGRTLATGGEDRTVRLWDVASGRLLRSLTGHTGNVLTVAFAPDGKTLASGSNDGTIRLWPVEAS
jgi:WD40 repeat protein